MKAIDRPRSMHLRLADDLRDAIISRELKPGELYSVAKLAEIFGVSRTPVREALLALASHGMVKFERNQGVRIQEATIHDIEEVFQIRLLLEPPAAHKVTTGMTRELLRDLKQALRGMQRAVADGDIDTMWEDDRRFHWLILAGTGNERLADYVDTLRNIVLTKAIFTAGRSRTPEDIVAEHAAVFESMELKDADAAASAMFEHIRHTGILLMKQQAGEAGIPLAVSDSDFDWTGYLTKGSPAKTETS